MLDPQTQRLDPKPSRVAFRVQNAPAHIRKLTVSIGLKDVEEPLFTYQDNDMVRFPGKKSEWSFSIGKDRYSELMNRSNDEIRRLVRTIEIEYGWLDGRKVYMYNLVQFFDPQDNQWTNERSDAS